MEGDFVTGAKTRKAALSAVARKALAPDEAISAFTDLTNQNSH